MSKTFFVLKGAQLNSFYEKGLRFTCQEGCRYCCAVEPGFVFLSEEDIKKLSDYLKVNEKEFVLNYCREVPFGSISYISLKERQNHDCIFLGDKGCNVYLARPIQCVTYPFWSSVVSSEERWLDEKQWCPGIDVGNLFKEGEIQNFLKMREAHLPALWSEVVNGK